MLIIFLGTAELIFILKKPFPIVTPLTKPHAQPALIHIIELPKITHLLSHNRMICQTSLLHLSIQMEESLILFQHLAQCPNIMHVIEPTA